MTEIGQGDKFEEDEEVSVINESQHSPLLSLIKDD
jgi:hypothetical protein